MVEEIAQGFYSLRKEYFATVNKNPKDLEALSPPEKHFIEDLECFDFVASGIARVIIRPIGNNDIIYKLARSAETETIYDGREQNDYEAFLSEAIFDEFRVENRPKLIPVLASSESNYWLKMPNAMILSELTLLDEEKRDIKDEVLRSLRPIIDNIMIGEVSSDNIGKHNGEYYLVDYGADPMVAQSL